ncbi:MAG TPA: hypothetical protein VJ697_08095 [Nitrososphaeraceae archaeon]|nr:hypothetical protein [Nitrososphaeraceae archaeon]
MDFNVSIGDVDDDIRILAPWLLNCLNRLSKGNLTKFILKQQVFAQTPMNGFKADPEKYQKYLDLKGISDYTRVIEPVIEFLERNSLVRISDVNQAKIAITQIGFDKCNEPTDIEESYNHTFYPIEDDDDIAKNPGSRNYK